MGLLTPIKWSRNNLKLISFWILEGISFQIPPILQLLVYATYVLGLGLFD